jgi:hypothetical protein
LIEEDIWVHAKEAGAEVQGVAGVLVVVEVRVVVGAEVQAVAEVLEVAEAREVAEAQVGDDGDREWVSSVPRC